MKPVGSKTPPPTDPYPTPPKSNAGMFNKSPQSDKSREDCGGFNGKM